jgi:hypothetical protein
MTAKGTPGFLDALRDSITPRLVAEISQVAHSSCAGCHRVPEPALLGVSADRPAEEFCRNPSLGLHRLRAVRLRTSVGELSSAFVFETS